MQRENFRYEILKHVPDMRLPFDGDCVQANGLELPVAVINLPQRVDKWQTVTKRLASIGLDKLVQVPAVAGAQLPIEQISAFLGTPADGIDEPPRDHLRLTRPAIGCFMSHLAVWRWMLKTKLPRVLVFEDDAVPAAGFDAARFRDVVATAKSDELTFVGQRIMAGMAEPAANSGLGRLYYFNGTFAYLITRDVAARLLGYLGQPRIHIDHQISQALIAHRHELIASYAEPYFFESDWSLLSDCYVPLEQTDDADRDLGQLIDATRKTLLNEGRALLPL